MPSRPTGTTSAGVALSPPGFTCCTNTLLLSRRSPWCSAPSATMGSRARAGGLTCRGHTERSLMHAPESPLWSPRSCPLRRAGTQRRESGLGRGEVLQLEGHILPAGEAGVGGERGGFGAKDLQSLGCTKPSPSRERSLHAMTVPHPTCHSSLNGAVPPFRRREAAL